MGSDALRGHGDTLTGSVYPYSRSMLEFAPLRATLPLTREARAAARSRLNDPGMLAVSVLVECYPDGAFLSIAWDGSRSAMARDALLDPLLDCPAVGLLLGCSRAGYGNVKMHGAVSCRSPARLETSGSGPLRPQLGCNCVWLTGRGEEGFGRARDA